MADTPKKPDRSAALKAKMAARKKAKEDSGEAARERAEKKAREEKKAKMKEMASLLGGELDGLIAEADSAKSEKEKEAADKAGAAAGEFKLFQTLYEFKSEDPEDLCFQANEVLRVYDWSDEWYEGENQEGDKGYFPATFVRELGGGGGSVGGGGKKLTL